MTAFKGLGTYGDAVGVVTPLDHKLAQAAQVTKTTTPLVIRPGLFYAGATTIVSGTAGMSYSVAAYQLVTQRSAGAGVVFGGNDGALSVATTAAPGSNSRIDVVYHWHREFALDGVNSNPVIGVVQGTAAASPTVPSLAAFPGAIELARITVNAAATATNGAGVTITQFAPFTSVDGGAVSFRNKTALDLWATAITGQEATDISTEIVYRWTGSEWVGAGGRWVPCDATSVVGATKSGLGRFVFTSAATVSLNGIFSSASSFYRLTFKASTSVVTGLEASLRASGTNSATGYDRQSLNGSSSSASASLSTNGSTWTLTPGVISKNVGTLELFDPATAVFTAGVLTVATVDNPMTTSSRIASWALGHRPSTAYDGFTIAPGAGTITGEITVERFLVA
jgi:hypothetical protein